MQGPRIRVPVDRRKGVGLQRAPLESLSMEATGSGLQFRNFILVGEGRDGGILERKRVRAICSILSLPALSLFCFSGPFPRPPGFSELSPLPPCGAVFYRFENGHGLCSPLPLTRAQCIIPAATSEAAFPLLSAAVSLPLTRGVW